MPDKNKAIFKLKNIGPIYYLNIEGQPERREYMENQFKYWGIKNYTRISAYDGREDDLIYNSGNTYSVPIFLYKLALGSSIHPEHIDLIHKASYDGLIGFWKQTGCYWKVDELMQFDPYLGRITEPVGKDK